MINCRWKWLMITILGVKERKEWEKERRRTTVHRLIGRSTDRKWIDERKKLQKFHLLPSASTKRLMDGWGLTSRYLDHLPTRCTSIIGWFCLMRFFSAVAMRWLKNAFVISFFGSRRWWRQQRHRQCQSVKVHSARGQQTNSHNFGNDLFQAFHNCTAFSAITEWWITYFVFGYCLLVNDDRFWNGLKGKRSRFVRQRIPGNCVRFVVCAAFPWDWVADISNLFDESLVNHQLQERRFTARKTPSNHSNRISIMQSPHQKMYL